MKRRGGLGRIAAGIFLAGMSGGAYAGGALDLSLPSSVDRQSVKYQPVLLAANETGMGQTAPASAPAVEPQTRWLTGNKLHQYLGLGTLALFGMTALSAPDYEGNGQPPTTGTHQSLGRATAAMAAATVVSGLAMHWDEIYWEDSFFDPDKMHARLGALGAAGMLYAVSKAPQSGHSGIGVASGFTMVVAIKMVW